MKNTYKLQLLAAIFTILFSISAKSQCVANFSHTLNTNGSVAFTNLSTNSSSNTPGYFWDFGDNQISFQASPTHVYAANGTYMITLFLNDSITPCTDSITQTITVSNVICMINAAFTASVFQTGNVNFYNTSTGVIPATTFTLDFGDGNTLYSNSSLGLSPHSYTANGTYTVILDAQNSASCTSSYSTVVSVNIQPCTLAAGFTYTETNGVVSFSNTSVNTNSNTGYFWDFSNSNFSSLQSPPPLTYSYNGQYTVSLYVNDSLTTGCSSIITQTINVTNAPCFAVSSFAVAKDSASTSSIVWNAYPYYPPNVSSVLWNWGDNTSSTGLYPSHTYSAAGMYNICLTVSVSCGSSTISCLNTNIFRGTNSMQMASINVINTSPTGIPKNPIPATNILLFPNPVKDILTIEGDIPDFNVTICDLYGKTVHTGVNTKTISMQELNPGIYFVKISGAGFSKISKIIKD